jgi:hypothetical protein
MSYLAENKSSTSSRFLTSVFQSFIRSVFQSFIASVFSELNSVIPQPVFVKALQPGGKGKLNFQSASITDIVSSFKPTGRIEYLEALEEYKEYQGYAELRKVVEQWPIV